MVLVSGPVAAGKTSLVRELERGYGFDRFGTREFILTRLPKTELTRAALQAAGDQLDAETNGRWVADGLVARMRESNVPQRFAVDSVRISSQVDAVRAITFITAYHVHVTASLAMLADRYQQKETDLEELASYDDVRKHPTEEGVEEMAKRADLTIDTTDVTAALAASRVAALWANTPGKEGFD